jgi:tRNA A37 threonylcarbamoyladenosine dehydratase
MSGSLDSGEWTVIHRFSRTEMLIGKEGLEILGASSVAVFGIGGVGSFAVEALARAGVGSLVLIDYDDICVTNINRQIHATDRTVGRAKVNVMKERVLEINPDARVTAYKMKYSPDSAGQLLDKGYDYVVDAIDMVSAKLDLIERCVSMNIPVISSMGAGNKLDPTLFRVADIYETNTCPLAKIIRKELRKRGVEALKVVYSVESPVEQKVLSQNSGEGGFASKEQEGRLIRRVPGSISFVPSVAGLVIASEVVKDLLCYERKK